MKAFILAAGLGTRLFPYTSDRPKALVELNGMTLLERAIRKVSELEVSEIVINIHHFGDQVITYLQKNRNFGFPLVISDERDQLLDTGGALLKARPILGNREPFLLYNVDVLSSVNLSELYKFHQNCRGIATLSVRSRETDRYLVFNPEMLLSGWRNVSTGEELLSRNDINLKNFAFSGIQIINPEIFPLITESGKFSLIQLYLRLAKTESIYGYYDSSEIWMDLGKPAQLEEAKKLIG